MSEQAVSRVVAQRVEGVRLVRRTTVYERRFKRAIDLLVTVLLLPIVVPLGLAIALCIRIGLGPGVLYSQVRVGRRGEPFTIWKFRTMRPDRRVVSIAPVSTERRHSHKVADDPRHTGLGRMLRRLSFDEIPQFFNVLRGEMSLVGPRPEVYEVAVDRGYLDHVRHDVRPGITGPYQVSDLRLNGDLRDGLELDSRYVDHVSLIVDIGCVLATLGVFLGVGRGGR